MPSCLSRRAPSARLLAWSLMPLSVLLPGLAAEAQVVAASAPASTDPTLAGTPEANPAPASAGPASTPFITIDAPLAEDQEILNVSQTSQQAPALLAKTNTGVPLAARLFLRNPIPDSGNFFTETGAGTYIDGIYYARPYGGLFDFIDIDQIDVIPSAQGTLFGRNTVDGAVLITTRQPGNTFAATGDLAFGTQSWFDARFAVSGPLVQDKVAASFSAVSRNRDGLEDAVHLQEQVNSRDYQEGRAKLLFTPTDPLDITLTVDMLRDRSSPKYPSSLSPFAAGQDPSAKPNRDIFTTEAVTPDINRLDQEGLAIATNYRFDLFTVKSLTAYRDLASKSYVTYDATTANVLSTETFAHQNTLTEDLSVNGDYDTFKGTAGLYYLRKDTKAFTPTGGSPSFSRELDYAYAFYAQVTDTIIDNVDLVGGLRYTIEDKDFDSDFYNGNKKATLNGKTKAIPAKLLSPEADSNNWYGFTPKAGVNYQVLPDLLAYFSFTRGGKSGGWNNRLPPNYTSAGTIDFRPLKYLAEAANEYEIGAKAGFLDNKLQLDVSAYIHDYTNLQMPVLLYNSSTIYLTTAHAAEITGLEIDPSWQVADFLQLYGLIALQHGNYNSAFQCQNTTGIYIDCSAQRLIDVAPLRAVTGFVVSPQLPIPGALRINLSLNYSDKYQNSILGVPLAATNSRTLVDASINYAVDDHWALSVEGRNLTNVHWFNTAFQDGKSVAVLPDDPRTIVGRIRYKY
jgi:iron complex outermembrane receptor protein